MRWDGHVALMGALRNAYNILVEKTERKGPLGRPRLIWENNIIIDLKKIGWEVADCIYVALDRVQWRGVVNKIMHLRVA
jgi:hypothetical protein